MADHRSFLVDRMNSSKRLKLSAPASHQVRKHCPHCDQQVTVKTFRRHKELYYRSNDGTWIAESSNTEDIESDPCTSRCREYKHLRHLLDYNRHNYEVSWQDIVLEH